MFRLKEDGIFLYLDSTKQSEEVLTNRNQGVIKSQNPNKMGVSCHNPRQNKVMPLVLPSTRKLACQSRFHKYISPPGSYFPAIRLAIVEPSEFFLSLSPNLRAPSWPAKTVALPVWGKLKLRIQT